MLQTQSKPENSLGKEVMSQKITPFLWFDNNAEEAVNFKSQSVMKAMLQMDKLNIKGLQDAYQEA
jgi:predicted 3-demethylubiquinone-9 3-methyltransferase (glyoxalase superfamily)